MYPISTSSQSIILNSKSTTFNKEIFQISTVIGPAFRVPLAIFVLTETDRPALRSVNECTGRASDVARLYIVTGVSFEEIEDGSIASVPYK